MPLLPPNGSEHCNLNELAYVRARRNRTSDVRDLQLLYIAGVMTKSFQLGHERIRFSIEKDSGVASAVTQSLVNQTCPFRIGYGPELDTRINR